MTIINDAQKDQIVAYSYEDQLIYLAGKLAQDNKALGFDTLMILSLAESVKAARWDNLNCPLKGPTFEQAWAAMEAKGYQYGPDALEQVRFGWELRSQVLGQDYPQGPRP